MLWCLHANNVRHNDFEPRNVLHKPWARFIIIDFALAETDHVCPGWGACDELQEALRALKLTSLASRARQVETTFRRIQSRVLFPLIHGLGGKLALTRATIFILSAFLALTSTFVIRLSSSHSSHAT